MYCNLNASTFDLSLIESFQKILSENLAQLQTPAPPAKTIGKAIISSQKSLKVFRLIFQYLHRLNDITCCFFLQQRCFQNHLLNAILFLATYYLMFFRNIINNHRYWRSFSNFKMLVYSFLSWFIVKWRNWKYCNKIRKNLFNSSTILLVSFPPTPNTKGNRPLLQSTTVLITNSFSSWDSVAFSAVVPELQDIQSLHL
jgi:hypothetical protein